MGDVICLATERRKRQPVDYDEALRQQRMGRIAAEGLRNGAFVLVDVSLEVNETHFQDAMHYHREEI